MRATAWGLHVMVVCLAAFSLFTNRFDVWVDLRALGGVGTALTTILWAVTALLVPWCAGPRLTGWRRPAWVNAGWSGSLANVLLWPTYFVMACLIGNTVYYYRLVMLERLDATYAIPVTLLVFTLLAAWALVTREWVRQARRGKARAAATWKTHAAAVAFGVTSATMGASFFLLNTFAQPPREPVDVAVVLGNRVLADGTASVTLTNRTLAAVDLYQRGLAKHLFLSGAVWPPAKADGPVRSEPVAMRKVCLDHGVAEGDITLDPYGINTRATAFNARAFMQARELTSVAACSDGFHLIRTAQCFRVEGIAAYTVPARPTEWICADVPGTVREVIGVVVYRLNRNYRAARTTDMTLSAARVVIRKAAGMLEIWDGDTLVKTYNCITGGHVGDKSVEGDRKTPVGQFHIVFKNSNSKYHLSLGLDYPSVEDADRGLRAGLITHEEYADILAALKSDLSLEENQKKLWYTPLGGEIFIHGNAEGRNATAGCISVTNADMDEIYAALPVGAPVDIRP